MTPSENLAGGALPLAAFRIVVAALIVTLPAVHAAPAMAALPPNQVPFGVAWLVPFIDPTGATVAWWGVVVGAVIGGVGLSSRVGFSAVTLCGAYLLAIPELRGGVQHYHHLLWFSASLADANRSQPYYGEVWGLTGLYGIDDPRARRLFWERVRGRPGVAEVVGAAVEVRFYRAERDVDPDHPALRRLAMVDAFAP